MKIIVEDKEIELDLPDRNVTLNEVIEEVETFLFEVGKIPIALTFNGEPWTQETLEARQDEILQGTETLEFGVQTIFEFINANLKGAKDANEELLKSIATFAEEIHSPTKTVEAEHLIDEINHFFEFWYKLKNLLPEDFEELAFGDRSFDSLFEDLRSLFEEIVASMEEKDFVLGADLLQYEVVPTIKSIHDAIPLLTEKVNARAALDQETLNIQKETL